jgi:hypothetical protein
MLGQAQVVGFGDDGLELIQRRRVQAGFRPAGVRLGLPSPLGSPGPQPAIERALAEAE